MTGMSLAILMATSKLRQRRMTTKTAKMDTRLNMTKMDTTRRTTIRTVSIRIDQGDEQDVEVGSSAQETWSEHGNDNILEDESETRLHKSGGFNSSGPCNSHSSNGNRRVSHGEQPWGEDRLDGDLDDLVICWGRAYFLCNSVFNTMSLCSTNFITTVGRSEDYINAE